MTIGLTNHCPKCGAKFGFLDWLTDPSMCRACWKAERTAIRERQARARQEKLERAHSTGSMTAAGDRSDPHAGMPGLGAH